MLIEASYVVPKATSKNSFSLGVWGGVFIYGSSGSILSSHYVSLEYIVPQATSSSSTSGTSSNYQFWS
jgi:hypothetical protein